MNILKTIEWAGMQFPVPGEWDIARHAVTLERGGLAFVDRRRQRMNLSWVPCTARPDIGRMMADSRSRDERGGKAHAFCGLPPIAPWRGYRWREEQTAISRAGRYDEVFGRWIEVVLLWPGTRDEALERRILETFTVTDSAGKAGRIRAFGMDVAVPPGWRLARALVRAGETVLRFAGGRTEEAEIKMIKALDAWFDGDLAGFAAQSQGKGRPSINTAQVNGHTAIRLSAPERGFRARWLVGRRRMRRNMLWVCPEQNALHEVTVYCRRRSALAPDSFTVVCCSGVKEDS